MVVRDFFPQPSKESLMEQVEIFFEYNAIIDAAETEPIQNKQQMMMV